jgi:hypothetical protein
MFKNIVRTIAFAGAILIAHACGNQLEIVDPNRLGLSQFYTTQEQAIAAVDAIYNSLIIDGQYQRVIPTIGDGRGDELRSNGGFPMWDQTAKFIIPTTEAFVEFPWRDNYTMILRANQALENVPKVPGLDDALKNRLLGQAYFMRAFGHFTLANIYEKPPIILESPVDRSKYYPSNKDVTITDVYAQVKADLTQAISMLPDDYNAVTGPDQGQVGRATRGAARSLMGKTLLYEGNHTAALPFFQAVVQSNIYDLGTNYADLFSQDPNIEAAVPERIFWVEFNQSTNPDVNWGHLDPSASWRQFSALAPTYSVANFADYAPTTFLYNEMREEKTIANTLDPRYHATLLSYEPTEGYTTAYGLPWATGTNGRPTTSFWIKKYTLAGTGGDPFASGINYHLIRFADVLLMYAECLANTGSIPAAAAQVQRVRDRANLPDREAEFAAYTVPQFMEQLAHERIMELAVESLRYYDVRRWGWLDNPAKVAELTANDPEFVNFVVARKYMPIPQRELDLNPNLVGNDYNNNK